jgi:hypothetical protein
MQAEGLKAATLKRTDDIILSIQYLKDLRLKGIHSVIARNGSLRPHTGVISSACRPEAGTRLFSQSKKGRKENSIDRYNILDYADNSIIAPEAQGALLLAQTADKMGGAGE